MRNSELKRGQIFIQTELIEMQNLSARKMLAKNNVSEWYEANKEDFGPPVCNKLMHRVRVRVLRVFESSSKVLGPVDGDVRWRCQHTNRLPH
jgi:hypothetical protein